MKPTRLPLLLVFIIISLYSHAQKYSMARQFNPTSAVLAEGQSIYTDASGNIYTSGYFSGTVDFDPGAGTFNLTATGSQDGYIAKLDASGNFLWAVRLGGTGLSYINTRCVRAGADGSVYAVGDFSGANFDMDPGPGSTLINPFGSTDIFMIKLDAGGTLVWARRVGSGSQDAGHGIGIDADNNVYVCGFYDASIDIDPGASVVTLAAASRDAFVLKLNAAGLYVNSYRLTTAAIDQPYAIEVKNGYVYMATWASIKAAITKFDLDLNVIWDKRTQGTGNMQPLAITVDDEGNSIITGSYTGAADWDPGTGVTTSTAGGTDIFTSKLDRNGNFKWARVVSGSGSSGVVPAGIGSDKNGNIYMTGKFTSGFQFEPGNDNSSLNVQGGADIFVQKLNWAGGFQWVVKMGGANTDVGRAICVDNNDNVFTTGYFINTADFNPDPAVSNTLTSFAGAGATFVSKLSASNHISGKVFMDINNDGIQQTGEAAFPYRVIRANNGSTDFSGISDASGRYDIYVDAGTYTIYAPVVPAYYTVTVPMHTANFSTSIGGHDSLNHFPVYPTPGVNDLSVKYYFHGRPRAGATVWGSVIYQNTGTTTLSGNVTLKHAAELVYLQASVAPDSYSNPLLTWNFTNLQPFETRSINLSFTIPTSTATGTMLKNIASILPVVNDYTPHNNTDSTGDMVVGSFDPNDKTVLPDGPVPVSFVSIDTNYLDYIVRFQNTGTDTAFNVIIADTIQSTLNLSSLQIIGASHPFTTSVDYKNILKFTFSNILLPDSTTNEPKSHGFIAFRLKPLNSLSANTTIRNRAAIYFDYNSAVNTNETQTNVINVLPVTLSGFDLVTASDCNKVLLSWTTSSETNNQFFSIERSTDNRTWSAIASIPGAGNSQGTTRYSYTDNTPVTAVTYYRLKQTNTNGTSTYSFTRAARCSKVGYLKIYPNPVKDVLYVETTEPFQYSLYDVTGKIIQSGKGAAQLATIELPTATKQMYLLKIDSPSGSSWHRIVVQ